MGAEMWDRILTRFPPAQTTPVAKLVANPVGKPRIWPVKAGLNLWETIVCAESLAGEPGFPPLVAPALIDWVVNLHVFEQPNHPVQKPCLGKDDAPDSGEGRPSLQHSQSVNR